MIFQMHDVSESLLLIKRNLKEKSVSAKDNDYDCAAASDRTWSESQPLRITELLKLWSQYLMISCCEYKI